MKPLLLFTVLALFQTSCAGVGNLAGTLLKTAGSVVKTAVTLPINTLSHYSTGS